MPAGIVSCDETEKASTKTAVEASKAVDSVYSFTSSPAAAYYKHLGAVT